MCVHIVTRKDDVKRNLKDTLWHKFACIYCQKRCKSKDSVQNHMKYSYTKLKEHECYQSDQKLAYKLALLSHLCGQKLKSVTTLRTNLRMHTRAKPYNCETCEQTFRQHPHLKRHNLIAHVGILKSKSSMCSLK